MNSNFGRPNMVARQNFSQDQVAARNDGNTMLPLSQDFQSVSTGTHSHDAPDHAPVLPPTTDPNHSSWDRVNTIALSLDAPTESVPQQYYNTQSNVQPIIQQNYGQGYGRNFNPGYSQNPHFGSQMPNNSLISQNAINQGSYLGFNQPIGQQLPNVPTGAEYTDHFFETANAFNSNFYSDPFTGPTPVGSMPNAMPSGSFPNYQPSVNGFHTSPDAQGIGFRTGHLGQNLGNHFQSMPYGIPNVTNDFDHDSGYQTSPAASHNTINPQNATANVGSEVNQYLVRQITSASTERDPYKTQLDYALSPKQSAADTAKDAGNGSDITQTWDPQEKTLAKLNDLSMWNFREKRFFGIYADTLRRYSELGGKDNTPKTLQDKKLWYTACDEATRAAWEEFEEAEIFEDLMHQFYNLPENQDHDFDLVKQLQERAKFLAARLRSTRASQNTSYDPHHREAFEEYVGQLTEHLQDQSIGIDYFVSQRLHEKAKNLTDASIFIDQERARILSEKLERLTLSGSDAPDDAAIVSLSTEADTEARQTADDKFSDPVVDNDPFWDKFRTHEDVGNGNRRGSGGTKKRNGDKSRAKPKAVAGTNVRVTKTAKITKSQINAAAVKASTLNQVRPQAQGQALPPPGSKGGPPPLGGALTVEEMVEIVRKGESSKKSNETKPGKGKKAAGTQSKNRVQKPRGKTTRARGKKALAARINSVTIDLTSDDVNVVTLPNSTTNNQIGGSQTNGLQQNVYHNAYLPAASQANGGGSDASQGLPSSRPPSQTWGDGQHLAEERAQSFGQTQRPGEEAVSCSAGVESQGLMPAQQSGFNLGAIIAYNASHSTVTAPHESGNEFQSNYADAAFTMMETDDVILATAMDNVCTINNYAPASQHDQGFYDNIDPALYDDAFINGANGPAAANAAGQTLVADADQMDMSTDDMVGAVGSTTEATNGSRGYAIGDQLFTGNNEQASWQRVTGSDGEARWADPASGLELLPQYDAEVEMQIDSGDFRVGHTDAEWRMSNNGVMVYNGDDMRDDRRGGYDEGEVDWAREFDEYEEDENYQEDNRDYEPRGWDTAGSTGAMDERGRDREPRGWGGVADTGATEERGRDPEPRGWGGVANTRATDEYGRDRKPRGWGGASNNSAADERGRDPEPRGWGGAAASTSAMDEHGRDPEPRGWGGAASTSATNGNGKDREPRRWGAAANTRAADEDDEDFWANLERDE